MPAASAPGSGRTVLAWSHVANNEGWVNVGDTADTSEFAVESIRRWWNQMGRDRFPDADRLLITADAGGSNGYRIRAWKVELAKLAEETGLRIMVCHYPPGTSKWNKLSLIHISEPTRRTPISYAVFCLKKKKINVTKPI